MPVLYYRMFSGVPQPSGRYWFADDEHELPGDLDPALRRRVDASRDRILAELPGLIAELPARTAELLRSAADQAR
jgi:hypothetical protein